MRGLIALGLVALTAALAAASQYLLGLDGDLYKRYVMAFWLIVAALTLTSLLWLYFQIALGPRVTVDERKARRLERALAAVRAGNGWFRKSRERRLTAEAQRFANMIEPASEARNVYLRRVRLTNAVLALIAVLSVSFWIFVATAPQLWPEQRWFENAVPPTAYKAAEFTVDQVTRGTMFDLFDVFDWSISKYHNHPENGWFSAFIVLYRFLIGGALVAALAVRLGMHEDWREKAAREAAEGMKQRLERLAAG